MNPALSASVSTSALALLVLAAGCGSSRGSDARDAGRASSATAASVDAAAVDGGPATPPGPPKKLFVAKFVVNVREAPNREAFRIGYLRAGAILQAKTSAPISREGCREGWYELETGGFVCANRDVTPFDGARPPERQAAQPDRAALLPYAYGYNRGDGVPMYRRLPTDEEAAQYEGYRIPGAVPAEAPTGESSPSDTPSAPTAADPPTPAPASAPDPSPSPAAPTAEAAEPVTAGAVAAENAPTPAADGDAGVPTLGSLLGERESVLMRRLVKGFYVSLDRDYRVRARRYWRTLSNGFVPYHRLHEVQGPRFRGVEVDGATIAFPLGWIMAEGTYAYSKDDRGRTRRGRRTTTARTPFRIVGEEEIRGVRYYAAADGALYRVSDVRRIEARPRPEGVRDDEKWIDIDLERQSVVAYIGDRPVYATLISSGRVEREDDPLFDHETPTGEFRITSKHIAATMDGDHAVDGPYSIEDVPYVMYFQLAYALHAAFWHNRFGRPKSHGCVNMAPLDARWMFDWTDPVVPPGWHGAYPTESTPGTRIYLRGVTPRG